MKVDPAIVQIFAENVRAEIIHRPVGLTLDPAIVQKIAGKVQVFKGMTHDCLLSTLAMAERTPVKATEIIFREGDIGTAFHVLMVGEVVIEKERGGVAVPLATLHPGECFGEMALVANTLRSATVRAVTDAVTLRFDRERVDAYADSAHIIYRNIARILAARLDTSTELLAQRMSRGPDHRDPSAPH